MSQSFTGYAATNPATLNGETQFKMAYYPTWVDEHANKVHACRMTSWVTVTIPEDTQLAKNVLESVRIGQPVIVLGGLEVRGFELENDTVTTKAYVRAQHVGHDLTGGQAVFTKNND